MEEHKEMAQEVSDERIRQLVRQCSKKRRLQRVWLRVVLGTVALALIVGACFVPKNDGIVATDGLKVYALDADIEDFVYSEMDGFVMENSVGVYSFTVYNSYMSLLNTEGIRLSFRIDDLALSGEEQVATITANYGDIHTDFYLLINELGLRDDPGAVNVFAETYLEEKRGEFVDGAAVCWRGTGELHDLYQKVDGEDYERGGVYIDVVIRAEEHIVGYAVVEILRSSGIYYPMLRASAYFPKIGENYQDITEEYVLECMEKAK